MEPVGVLFVCLGNICRSPMAEAVFQHQVRAAALTDHFRVESAGTGDWHIGSRPHPETLAQLKLNSVQVGDCTSRQICSQDADGWHYIVAMDTQNLSDLQRMLPDCTAEMTLLLEHVPEVGVKDVPDPYGVGGYDRVYDLVSAGCAGLLQYVCEREEITPSARRASR